MADEETTGAAAQKRKGGLVRKLGVFVGVVLVAAILGLVTYKLVVAPMFEESPEEEGLDKILPTAVTIQFDESRASVIMEDPNALASILSFRVSLECANRNTLTLVENHKARFNAMINSHHQFWDRAKLDDELTQQEIQRQILEEANILLKRLQEKPDPEVWITAVLYDDWLVFDQ